MSTPLRQSTQRVVRIGPVVAVGDGFTPVTTLDLSTADEAELLKAAGAATVSIAAATFAAVTGADGYYDLTLTTSHTDTLQDLTVAINDDSLCLPVRKDFTVLPQPVYDLMNGATTLGVQQTADHTAAIADLPTNAELTSALGSADDAVLAAIAALNNLSSANVQTVLDACGITTAAGVGKIAGVTLAEGGTGSNGIGEAV